MMKPEPAPAPARSTPKSMLVVMLGLYALWLLGLAYVAWVNVQSGNQ